MQNTAHILWSSCLVLGYVLPRIISWWLITCIYAGFEGGFRQEKYCHIAHHIYCFHHLVFPVFSLLQISRFLSWSWNCFSFCCNHVFWMFFWPEHSILFSTFTWGFTNSFGFLVYCSLFSSLSVAADVYYLFHWVTTCGHSMSLCTMCCHRCYVLVGQILCSYFTQNWATCSKELHICA
jgi:hypothetical protein